MNRFKSETFCGSIVLKACAFAFLLTAIAPIHASSARIGSRAPGFELPDMNGKTVSLERLTGRVVFLSFWAPWCVSCRKELPELDSLYSKYAGRGLDVIGICVDPSASTIKKFLRQFPLTFPILLDLDGKVSDTYRVTGLPASFILDGNGVVRYRHRGFEEESLPVYIREIEELLEQSQIN